MNIRFRENPPLWHVVASYERLGTVLFGIHICDDLNVSVDITRASFRELRNAHNR